MSEILFPNSSKAENHRLAREFDERRRFAPRVGQDFPDNRVYRNEKDGTFTFIIRSMGGRVDNWTTDEIVHYFRQFGEIANWKKMVSEN